MIGTVCFEEGTQPPSNSAIVELDRIISKRNSTETAGLIHSPNRQKLWPWLFWAHPNALLTHWIAITMYDVPCRHVKKTHLENALVEPYRSVGIECESSVRTMT